MNAWSKAYGSKATKQKIYLGKVLNYYKKHSAAEILLETGNIQVNDHIMLQGPTTGVIEQKVSSMQIDNKSIEKAKKGQRVGIKTNKTVRKNDKLFIVR